MAAKKKKSAKATAIYECTPKKKSRGCGGGAKKAGSRSKRSYACAGARKGCGTGSHVTAETRKRGTVKPKKKKTRARAQAKQRVKEKETMAAKKKTARKPKKAAARKAPKRKRKANPAGTAVAANPAPKRRKRAKKAGAKKGHRHHHHAKRRKHPRKSNPSVGGTILNILVGSIGVLAAGVAGYGIRKTSLSAGWQAAITGVAGLIGGVPVGLLSPAAGIGFGTGMELQAGMQAVQVLTAPAASSGSALADETNQLGAVELRSRLLMAQRAGLNAVEDLEGVIDDDGLGAVEVQLGAVVNDYH